MNKKFIHLLLTVSILQQNSYGTERKPFSTKKAAIGTLAVLTALGLTYFAFKSPKASGGKSKEEKLQEKTVLVSDFLNNEERNKEVTKAYNAIKENLRKLDEDLERYHKEVINDIKIDENKKITFDDSKYFIEHNKIYRYLINKETPFYLYIADIEDKKIELSIQAFDIDTYIFNTEDFKLTFNTTGTTNIIAEKGGKISVYYKNKKEKKDMRIEIYFTSKLPGRFIFKSYYPEDTALSDFIKIYTENSLINTYFKKIFPEIFDFHIKYDTNQEQKYLYTLPNEKVKIEWKMSNSR